jgi:hypothetical protein
MFAVFGFVQGIDSPQHLLSNSLVVFLRPGFNLPYPHRMPIVCNDTLMEVGFSGRREPTQSATTLSEQVHHSAFLSPNALDLSNSTLG